VALAIAAGVGALVAVARDALKLIPATLPMPIKLAGHELGKWTLALKTEVLLIGAGALMSFRTGWSMLLGAVVTYGVIAPLLVEHHEVATVGYKAIVNWTLWPGAGILVGSGITSFLLDWKSLKRAFAGMARHGAARRRRDRHRRGRGARLVVPCGLPGARPDHRRADGDPVRHPGVGRGARAAAVGGDGLHRRARHRRDRHHADQGARPGDADDVRRAWRPATCPATSCRPTSPAASASTPPIC
jgi:hypothetical protein